LVNTDLLSKCVQDYYSKLPVCQTMKRYYDSQTDAILNYEMTDRSNIKIPVNYIQKFIAEEASYTAGNKLNFTSNNNDKNALEAIRLHTRHWSEKYNKELVKHGLIFNEAYSLFYIDDIKGFSSLICTPLDSYILQDDYGNIELFIRFFRKKFDSSKTLYADVYTNEDITHYTVNGTSFIQILNSNIDENKFSKIPVAILPIGEVSESIYSICKGLQDGYETTLSNIINEICDLRTSYLTLTGVELDEDKIKDMKRLGIMNLPSEKATASWLIKNINDNFIQNALTTLEDKMYQLTSHINHNADLASNTSSLAMKNRLIGLQQRCTNIIQALEDCIKVRLQFLFEYVYKKTGELYDYRDINIIITANLPSDDLMFSQIWSQVSDKISLETGLSQFSFISNPDIEIKRLKQEQEELLMGQSLLDNAENNTGV
jgi:SPP1 family phage portal protein